MNKVEILTKLKTLMVSKLDINLKEEELENDIPLFEGGIGLDSISIVNLIGIVEDEFNFQFEDEEVSMERFASLETLSEFILSKVVVDPLSI